MFVVDLVVWSPFGDLVGEIGFFFSFLFATLIVLLTCDFDFWKP